MEYELIADCIIGGERKRAGERVGLTDAQAEWARGARVISSEAAKKSAPKKSQPKAKK
ncbi:MAG TPA: hypothetical protein VK039_12360 [Brevibacterium sp.]|nr:hypothetical protein [Brevibacterium sp.]